MVALPIIVICLFLKGTAAFQDITMGQIEYIANHISQTDCRRLVASLRSTSYEIDKRYTIDGLEIPPSKPCITLLVAWSEEERDEEVLSVMTHRLHQLGYPELAQWLSLTTLNELEGQLRKQLLVYTVCRDKKLLKTENSTNVAPTLDVEEQKQESAFYNYLGSRAFRVNILIGVLLLGGVVLLIVAVKCLVKCCLRYRHRVRGYKNVEYKFEPRPAPNIDFDEVYNRYCEC